MQIVAVNSNFQTSEKIIAARASECVISSAIPHAMSITQCSVRFNILDVLSDKGASGPNVSFALVAATAMGLRELDLIDAILKTGVSINQIGGRDLKNTVIFYSKEVVESITTNGNPSLQSRQAAFQCVFRSRVRERLEKAEAILQSGLDHNYINKGLIQELTDGENMNRSLVKLLLQHGARYDYAHGKAFELAIESPSSYPVLLQTILIKNLDPCVLAQKFSSRHKSNNARENVLSFPFFAQVQPDPKSARYYLMRSIGLPKVIIALSSS